MPAERKLGGFFCLVPLSPALKRGFVVGRVEGLLEGVVKRLKYFEVGFSRHAVVMNEAKTVRNSLVEVKHYDGYH